MEWVKNAQLFVSWKDSLTRIRMALKALTDDEKAELREQFTAIDKDESG